MASRNPMRTTTSKTVTKTPTSTITKTVRRTTRDVDEDYGGGAEATESSFVPAGGIVRLPSPETLAAYKGGLMRKHQPTTTTTKKTSKTTITRKPSRTATSTPGTSGYGANIPGSGIVGHVRPTKTSRARSAQAQQAKIQEIMAPKQMKTTTSRSSLTKIGPSGSKSTITKTRKVVEKKAPRPTQAPQVAQAAQQAIRSTAKPMTTSRLREREEALAEEQRRIQQQSEEAMRRGYELEREYREQQRRIMEQRQAEEDASFERAERECLCDDEFERAEREFGAYTSPPGAVSPRPTQRRPSPAIQDRGVDIETDILDTVPQRRAASPRPRSPEKHPVSPLETSMLYADVAEALQRKYLAEQAKKHKETGTRVTDIPMVMIETPSGMEAAIQQLTVLKRVERSGEGEKITKHLTGVNANESGRARQVELDVQSLDPKERLHTGALKEVVSVTSSLAVTQGHTQATQHILREIQSIDTGVNMTPEQLVLLVSEENEDVETTMKIIPPELIEASPEKYGLKKRLEKLRLNSESVALVEQSVVYPTPTADEEQAETPPEAIATIMHSIEKGVTPKSPPNQVFKALFSEHKETEVMTVCSVAPGPLSDVVVPTDVPNEMVKESMDAQMEKTIEMVQLTEEKPQTNIFVESKPAEPKAATKPKKKREPKPISEEKAPWTDADLEPMLELAGAVQHSLLQGVDLSKLGADEAEEQLVQGIEYYLDAEPMQYYSRIQLRGSQMPTWFPGYMVALPEISEVVKISRTPSDVLTSAWKAVQPKMFPDDSVVTIDF